MNPEGKCSPHLVHLSHSEQVSSLKQSSSDLAGRQAQLSSGTVEDLCLGIGVGTGMSAAKAVFLVCRPAVGALRRKGSRWGLEELQLITGCC